MPTAAAATTRPPGPQRGVTDIPWFKVDDTLHSHPKTRRAGLAAMGLWTVAGSYSMAYKTDGFVPTWFVAGLPTGKRLAKQLVDCGLWSHEVRDGDPGFIFHDWADYQPSSDEIEADREKARERQRARRQRLREARDKEEDVTPDVTRDAQRDSRTPVPTRPGPPPLMSVSPPVDDSPTQISSHHVGRSESGAQGEHESGDDMDAATRWRFA